MKKLIVAILFLAGTINLYAQTDAKAKSILDEVSRKYSSYGISKAVFTYVIEDPDTKAKQLQSGTLFIKANTDKYKLSLKSEEIMSDGKTQWTYLKDDNEVQIANFSPKEFNPSKIFTIYQTGYKYLYTGDSHINGRPCYQLELVPLDNNGAIFKVRLSVEKVSKRIASALIFDKNGNRYTYLVKTFVPNIKISDAIFTFDKSKYPGVEIVDLR